MPKQTAGLTARQVQTIKDSGMHADGGGLYLSVKPNGHKSWIFRFQWGGKRREMGLGPVSSKSLAGAREAARAAKKLVDGGTDPIECRKAHAAEQRNEAAGTPSGEPW